MCLLAVKLLLLVWKCQCEINTNKSKMKWNELLQCSAEGEITCLVALTAHSVMVFVLVDGYFLKCKAMC